MESRRIWCCTPDAAAKAASLDENQIEIRKQKGWRIITILYDIFGTPFGWIMRLIYQLVNNYGVAIVLFTIITKILLFPISYKQQKNTLRMQLIQPKLKKLQAKYKDKPQELQQAQMQLYQEEHVNPMSSCLPMFLQFFLLFGVLDVVYKPLTHILHYSKSVISRVVEISIGILGDSVAKQYTGLKCL